VECLDARIVHFVMQAQNSQSFFMEGGLNGGGGGGGGGGGQTKF
jgi:hypothetical protein